jgi:hypothetical protein
VACVRAWPDGLRWLELANLRHWGADRTLRSQ